MKRFLFVLLAAVMIMGSTVTAFAMEYPTGLPELPTNYNSQILIYKYNDATRLYIFEVKEPSLLSTVEVRQDLKYSTTVLQLVPHSEVKTYMYSLDNGTWRHNSTQTYSPGTAINIFNYSNYELTGFEYLYSTVNVVDVDTGEVVFPLPPVPLAEEIRELTEETLTVETMPELTETVLVVVLCGVGCLALVISLPLLKKVLSRFLA